MNVFEAKQLRFDCLECKARETVELEVQLDREEVHGFSVLAHKCRKCGERVSNTESYTAVELLGA